MTEQQIIEWAYECGFGNLVSMPHIKALTKLVNKGRAYEREQAALWKPIETAPKTGKFLIGVYSGDMWDNVEETFTVFEAHGDPGGPVWSMKDKYRTAEGGVYRLVGWMDAPLPPVSKKTNLKE